jgi:GNAT superfamily N-acetyltransferase
MHVRPAVDSDHAEWLPLWQGYNAFYGRVGATALPAATSAVTWRRFLDPAEPVGALVAEDAGRLVGIAHYLFHRSTTEVSDVCYLQDLFTAGERRGEGVGRLLIEGVCKVAREAGCPRVYWHTHETNEQAIALYTKLADHSGFVVFRRPP